MYAPSDTAGALGVLIEGGGIAGQVLHRELEFKGIASKLVDTAAFPRDKVCGGILQPDSWEYLNSRFQITEPCEKIYSIAHYWNRRRLSRIRLTEPLYFIPRLILDSALNNTRSDVPPVLRRCLMVKATGIGHGQGKWIGFQSRTECIEDLKMYYSTDLYCGVSASSGEDAHAALIMRKSAFTTTGDLKTELRERFGLCLTGPLKGTGRIHYGYTSSDLAVGDAKMTTHPFLGLGMKHAIQSARLMADLIERNETHLYSKVHKRMFRKFNLVSSFTGRCFESKARICLWPVLKLPFIFLPGYRWLHRV